MLKESAVVMSYDAETGLAKVKCQSQSACGACSARKPVEQLPCLNSMENEASISSRSKPLRHCVQAKWWKSA